MSGRSGRHGPALKRAATLAYDRTMHTLLATLVAIGTLGCTMAAAPATRPTTAPHDGTKFTIALPTPGHVEWTARVNTGGWKLTTDRIVVEAGVAKVYATLERPLPGEMVGQAFTTLKGEGTAADATTAELFVRRDAIVPYERVAGADVSPPSAGRGAP